MEWNYQFIEWSPKAKEIMLIEAMQKQREYGAYFSAPYKIDDF